MAAVQFLDYMADGTLYFSFWTTDPDTLSRLLRRMPNGDWRDIGAPFFVQSLSVGPRGKLLVSTNRNIAPANARYTEVISQTSFGGTWKQEFSFIAGKYKNVIYDINFSPYANVTLAAGRGVLLISVDNGPWTIDSKSSRELYDRVPSNNLVSNLIWISPTVLVGNVQGAVFIAELDFTATSIDERTEIVAGECFSNEATQHIDVFSVDGRILFSGNYIAAGDYVQSARGCMAIVYRSTSAQSFCKPKFICK